MALGFIKTALSVVAKAVGIDDVGKAALKTVQALIGKDPELQKQLAEQELEFKKLSIEEGDSIRKMFAIEIESESRVVKWARPAMLWLVSGIIGTNFIVLPILNALITVCGGTTVEVVYPEIPDSVLMLLGTLVSVYVGARSWDKKNKNRR